MKIKIIRDWVFGKNRYELFIGHYKILRKRQIPNLPFRDWNVDYGVINCTIWAWHNSGTHDLDGNYLK